MFKTLIDSEPTGGSDVSPSTWGFSTVVHILLVTAVFALAGRSTRGAVEPVARDVTYLDIADAQPLSNADPPDLAPDPAPPPTATAETEMAAPENVPPAQLAGFRELRVPDEVTGIPEPTAAVAVRAEDFRGRGVIGGIGGGLELRRSLPQPSAGADTSSSARLPSPPVNVVQTNARILNADELMPQMERLYPPSYRSAGIEGSVLAQFAVDVDGRVDPEGLVIVESSHPGFEEPTRKLLLLLRWQPARQDGRSVRTWVRMPVTWNIR